MFISCLFVLLAVVVGVVVVFSSVCCSSLGGVINLTRAVFGNVVIVVVLK